MEAAWLQTRLESGRSIESIAREVGKAASTVAYWVNKHGLMSHHAARHAPKGAIEEGELRALVERGLSIRQIAGELDRSAATVRHWLSRYELATQPARYSSRGGVKPSGILRECAVHGWVAFVRTGAVGRYRCGQCNGEAVSARRRRVKELLVAEAGGACAICGYHRYAGALQFHHIDPAEKSFSLSERGLARSLEKARAEVAKCVLPCANCHAEVEGRIATIPRSGPADNPQ
jgi:transposase-like protein